MPQRHQPACRLPAGRQGRQGHQGSQIAWGVRRQASGFGLTVTGLFKISANQSHLRHLCAIKRLRAEGSTDLPITDYRLPVL